MSSPLQLDLVPVTVSAQASRGGADGDVRAFVAGVLGDIYKARTTDNVWQWAENNVFLDESMSPAFPGFYDSSLTPYARLAQEFATDQYTNAEFTVSGAPHFDECVIMKSSQLGLTESVLNIIRYLVANAPCHIAYIIDSFAEAQKMSKTRLQPSLQKCPATAQAISANADDFGNLTMYLRGMVIHMLGSYSSGALANKPIGLIVLDELDKHQPNPRGEAETIDLARDRLKTTGGKLVALSTPVTDRHVTWREYKTGTQHQLHVPCPHCGDRQPLVFEHVRFAHCKDLTGEYDLERVLRETFYECRACHQPINESQKNRMVAAGVWRQSNPQPIPRKLSVHISDLYSPFVAWGKLAVEFIQANRGGDLSKLQHFRNNRLGLPFVQERAEVSGNDVLKLRGAYKRGQCPFAPCLVTMCVDKQEDVLKYTKAGFKPNGEMAVIDYGYTLVDYELLDRADEEIEILGATEKCAVKLGLIDEGFKALEVRDFVAQTDGRFFASKGRGGIQVKQTVAVSRTPHKDQYLDVYHYDDDNFKKLLYLQRIAKHDKIVRGEIRVPRLWLPADVEPHFVAELVSEKLVEEADKRGYSRFIWTKKDGDKNDFGDTLKMHLVIWHELEPMLAVDKT
ncbi:MAG: phage terminase large subunit family protein [Verrucomicrobiales bacterium]|jgi:phage terminase large subunit GpA-like protein|nr:phage terminase large subunit family protein [Verrucomicrobiales bacterium]